jgi:predicted acetyltransferase
MATDVRLRPPRIGDEAAVRAAQEAMAEEDFTFALNLEPGMAWADWLALVDAQRRDIDVPAGLVPATFLLADVDGEVVGRSSIRHHIDHEFLAREGGHIGYGVLRDHRRRGYATEILGQSLVVARAVGVDRVLVTCEDTNVGSATVIERCGGVFESLTPTTGSDVPTRRYWIA